MRAKRAQKPRFKMRFKPNTKRRYGSRLKSGFKFDFKFSFKTRQKLGLKSKNLLRKCFDFKLKTLLLDDESAKIRLDKYAFIHELILDFNNAQSKDLEGLKHLKRLIYLQISDESLTQGLFNQIYMLKRLEFLYLFSNLKAQKGSSLYLSAAISRLKRLKVLQINAQISHLPKELFTLKRLQSLCISGLRAESLSEDLGALKELKELSLTHSALQSLPDSLGELLNLKSLNLSFSRVKTLPKSIEKLDKLELLDLSHTQIQRLDFNIKALKNLKCLKIHGLEFKNEDFNEDEFLYTLEESLMNRAF